MVPCGITNLRQENRDLILPWIFHTVEVPLAPLTLFLQRLSPLAVVLAISIMANMCEGWEAMERWNW